MIHHECTQGGEEWKALRLGRPTASSFHRIITAKKWDYAAGAISYAVELLTERILGVPLDGAVTPAMLHGTDWESTARAAYEMMTGIDVTPCGFCSTDDGTAGASPDAFVGEDGSLELKCPFKPEIHVGYLLHPKDFVQQYWVQVQGQLFVTGRKWTDLVSYFRGLPMVCERVIPSGEFQSKLAVALKQFAAASGALEAIALERGVKFADAAPVPDHSRDFISEEDEEAVIDGLKREGKL